MSVRSEILADIEAVLKGIPDIGDVFVGKYEQVDLDALKFPAIFIFQGDDQEAIETMGTETFTWRVVVEAWCKDAEAETVFAALHMELSRDYTRSGNALNCRRTGSDVLSLDPGRGLIALQQTYEILYRHPYGQP
ncbi:MAG: hypothetical protein D4R80_06565 [Deltaproteobacteria bacterium]|nr:MAG: hypothetical protein D4R80_06565 [Deltaproteobacteria bacterium]